MANPPPSSPLIELKNVIKFFHIGDQQINVLNNISLNIYEGELIAIMGASGSGKSTLMNIIGCLEHPNSGSYTFDGKNISLLTPDETAALRCHVFGFIFQRYNLLPKDTVLENVKMPAMYAGSPRQSVTVKAIQLLSEVGLSKKLDYYPSQLSGGEQQRVAIARSLINGGRVILADEPTGALDTAAGDQVLKQLQAIHKQGHTIILVTHSLDVAEIAQRLIHLRDGEILTDTGVNLGNPILKQTLDEAPRPKFNAATTFEAMITAWRSLQAHGFRTLLTMLGIIIGVSSVVTMLALGNGTKAAVLEKIKSIGTNLILVKPGTSELRGSSDTFSLSLEDVNTLKTLPNVEYVLPEHTTTATIRYGDTAVRTNIIGTSEDFPATHNWPTEKGVFFDNSDYTSYTPVAVVGQTVVKNIFSNLSTPVGQFFLIGNVPFLLIGVMEGRGAGLNGMDQDDAVWVPITTGQARIYGGKPIAEEIYLKGSSPETIDEVIKDAIHLLRERHNTVDFHMHNMENLLNTTAAAQNKLTFFIGSIACIALLVGGIGVMNIMILSVAERTREVGIRIATGARAFDILKQFLAEALAISLISGILGIGVGLGAAWTAKYFGADVEFSLSPVLLAFGCSCATGLIFGYLPAKKAAKMNPVKALNLG